MLIRAHLYWLNGYPEHKNGQLIWNCPHTPGEMDKARILTPAMISKAHRVINELQRDYPIALAKVVGDVSQWIIRSKSYLDYCKILLASTQNSSTFSLFDKEKKYAVNYLKKLSKEQSQSGLVEALSWLHYINRKPLDKSLVLILQYRPELQQITHYKVFLLSQICQIYALDGKKAQGLLHLFFNPAGLKVVTGGGRDYVMPFRQFKFNKKKKIQFDFPEKPKENNSAILKSLLPWLLSLNNVQRRNALALITGINLENSLKQWSQWWQDVELLTGKIGNLIVYADKHKINQLYCLQYDLKLCLDRCPQTLNAGDFYIALQKFSNNTALAKGLINFFNQLAKGTPAIASNVILLIHFYRCIIETETDTRSFLIYLKELSKYLSKYSAPEFFLAWKPLKSSFWSTSEYEIFEHLSHNKISPFFSVLGLLNELPDISVSKSNIDELVLIIAAGFDEKRATDLASFLIINNEFDNLSEIVLQIVFDLNESNENSLKLIKIWNKLDEEYTDDDTLEVIYNTFLSINAQELFRHLIFSDQHSILLHCCYQIRVIQKISGLKKVPRLESISEQNNDWILQYPEVFSSHLARFNYVSREAEAKTKKFFLSSWWPKSFIENELISLKNRFSNNKDNSLSNQSKSLQLRIENLEKKLIKHRSITQKTQNKILSKIIKQTFNEQFKLWKNSLEKQFQLNWATFFQLELSQIPSWLLEDDMVKKLLPIIDFKPGSQKLAKIVIQRRNSNQTWDFRDLPKNQNFLNLLSKQGVNIQIWLNGIGKYTYQAESSVTVSIDVATDPLEIINMGGHFKTCLSPGNFNYFSVFANIADINKRVIYAKNSKGKVIGRVLIGLLPSGGIKIFNIYYHNAADKFEKYVLRYIENWAQQAGLTLTNRGELPTLIANKWYDDGAIDVDNGIKCFKPDSEFRKQLKNISPDDFKSFFENHLKPLQINELTFPMLLQLTELKDADLLLPVIIELARSIPRLSIYEKLKLYKLTRETESEQHYYRVFRKAILSHLDKSIRDDWFDVEIAKIILKHNPIDALKVIRKLGRSNKNWQDCLYYDTAQVAVEALKKLGREQQANLLISQYHLKIE